MGKKSKAKQLNVNDDNAKELAKALAGLYNDKKAPEPVAAGVEDFDNNAQTGVKTDINAKVEPAVRSRIALVMMVKNEEKRIEVSFDSVRPYTDTFVILDTGSVDRTIDICREYCKRHNITLHLKEEPFVNFMVSRNVLLDFADQSLKSKRFLLQLDCNDELRNAHALANLARTFEGPQTGFYIKQQWWTGTSYDSYFNVRLVISHSGWRYKGVVHEYICKSDGSMGGQNDVLRIEDIILFQDRTKDDDKSQKRFTRDKDLLYTEHLKDPREPRTLFYLAQTCGCLGLHQEAYQYYILRTKETGFIEEVYHSYARLAELATNLGHCWEESMSWYLKAYGHSKRAEPLVKIAEHYKDYNTAGQKTPDWGLCYAFASMATKLLYPHNQILFVDRQTYSYKRWHILGIAAYYVGRFVEGKEACIRAIQAENKPIDMDNLVLYLKKDKEIVESKEKGFLNLDWSHLTTINSDFGDLVPQQEQQYLAETAKIPRDEVRKMAYGKLLKK